MDSVYIEGIILKLYAEQTPNKIDRKKSGYPIFLLLLSKG